MKRIILLTAVFFLAPRANAALPFELQSAIAEKARQLQAVHDQILAQQKNLQESEARGRTLNQELKNIDQNLLQLNLGIKSNQLTIEKFNLEIESLKYEIENAQRKISLKKEGINRSLKELQQKDTENLLIIFLKNQSLTESLAEADNLSSLSETLRDDINDLLIFKSELKENLQAAAGKKSETEEEQTIFRARKGISEEQKQDRRRLLEETKNQEKIYEQVLKDLEGIQMSIAEEVEALEAQLRAQINPDLLPAARPGVLSWPLTGRLSQTYGATSFARRGGYPGRWHNGVDIAASVGAPIAAAADGVVIASGDQDKFCRRGAYGKYVVVKHHNNLTTLYAHLSRHRENLTIGSSVNRGDPIGYVGNTGYSRGSHLHFTVYDGKTFALRPSNRCGLMPSGGDLDPTKYL